MFGCQKGIGRWAWGSHASGWWHAIQSIRELTNHSTWAYIHACSCTEIFIRITTAFTRSGLDAECLSGDVTGASGDDDDDDVLSLLSTAAFLEAAAAAAAMASVRRFCCSGALALTSSSTLRSASLLFRLSLCTDWRCNYHTSRRRYQSPLTGCRCCEVRAGLSEQRTQSASRNQIKLQ